MPDEENEKESKILEKAKRKSEFHRQFGRGLVQADVSDLAKRWKGPDADLDVSLTGSEFNAVGSYEQPSFTSLGLAFMGRTPSSADRSDDLLRMRVEYQGTVFGQAIEARVTRAREGDKPTQTLLGSSADATKVLLVASKRQQ